MRGQRHTGIGPLVIHFCLCRIQSSHLHVDAPNFYESSFWKDSNPVSGLGGWGNQTADYSVLDGGFSRLHLSYPVPHIVRRNYTLLPFDFPYLFFTEPRKEGNASFSASVVESILQTSAGNFKSFHVSLEAFEVGS
jgi:tyrosinase